MVPGPEDQSASRDGPMSEQSGHGAERLLDVTGHLTIDLDLIARSLLAGVSPPNEELLEIYRWTACTMSQTGIRWRDSDPWGWCRYPGHQDALGLARWSEYPINEDRFGLCFVHSSSQFRAKLRSVVIRAGLSNHPAIAKWRRSHPLKSTIPCSISRSKSVRASDTARKTV